MAVRSQAVPAFKISEYSDILVVLGVIMVVVMMIIPLPPILLDVLLACNITLGLVILMVTMSIKKTLEFSVFPSLLLITTLFRLALNVSSTRLILLHGYAGEVIMSFGNFVVGGNYVVGFVIFAILIVIQFIVITRGAERVAEVGARFTLDAMPGKQMSIDADLNAGLINEQQAIERRKEIRMEADFYGAMDGASKFVKGDAIAAIIIIFINIIGGLIIGMMQKGMPLMQALQHYTLLTVGEGLVNQIPALLISTGTGVIVTRAASEANLGTDLIKQMVNQPKILMVASAILVFFGLIPGLPKIPFFILAALIGTLAYSMQQSIQESVVQEEEEEREKELEEVKKPESVINLLQVDPLELEIGYSLIPLVDPKQGGDLLDRITLIRRQCALELGLVVPAIRIRDNMQLKPNLYTIKIAGLEIAEGELMIGHYMAMDPGMVEEQIEGIPTVEPAFGLPAIWVKDTQRSQAEMAGYTVVDLPSIVATHLTEVIKGHAHELLGRQDVQSLIDSLRGSHSAVIEELIPNMLSLGEIQKVLQNLLKEGISIRNLVTILETLADYARLTKDTDVLTEYVRQALARNISKQYQSAPGTVTVITLDPQLEQLIAESIQHSDYGSYVAIDPNLGQQLLASLAEETQRIASMGYQPIVLTSPNIRLHFKRLTERVAPGLIVLSYNELESNLKVQSIGMVKI